MARRLKKLAIAEISVVERGAGESCRIAFFKADGSPAPDDLGTLREMASRQALYLEEKMDHQPPAEDEDPTSERSLGRLREYAKELNPDLAPDRQLAAAMRTREGTRLYRQHRQAADDARRRAMLTPKDLTPVQTRALVTTGQYQDAGTRGVVGPGWPVRKAAIEKMAAAVTEVRKRHPELMTKSDSVVRAKISEMPEFHEVWQAYKQAA